MAPTQTVEGTVAATPPKEDWICIAHRPSLSLGGSEAIAAELMAVANGIEKAKIAVFITHPSQNVVPRFVPLYLMNEALLHSTASIVALRCLSRPIELLRRGITFRECRESRHRRLTAPMLTVLRIQIGGFFGSQCQILQFPDSNRERLSIWRVGLSAGIRLPVSAPPWGPRAIRRHPIFSCLTGSTDLSPWPVCGGGLRDL